MSVRRVTGIETEFGVTAPGDPAANPMLLSAQVVNAYAAPLGGKPGGTAVRARWDYEDEAPLRDARGFELERAAAHPSQLTDAPGRKGVGRTADFAETEDPTMANVILTNGARLYVDHAHPEYSTPEVTTPRDAVLWDRAGERVVLESVRRIGATPGLSPVNVYKNNTDGKGASYGTHENYLMDRATPFADIVRHLTPFFVSRQVFSGAGRVGIGQDSRRAGFQISQRADFFEVEVGLETTLKRPIINTRDEPHATAEKYRRLHVIIGDATMCEVATLLKVGTTSLVLAMVEAGALDGGPAGELSVAQPVAELHAVSHDPSLRHLVRLRDGRRMSAVQLQWAYLEAAAAFVAKEQGESPDPDTAEVLQRWESVLQRLERDPALCAREVDWVAKLRLLQGYRDRDGLEWDSARLQAIDLQWSDVRPEKGLYQRLAARGQVELLLDEAQIAAAVTQPPEDTRAYFRGQCLARYGSQVAAASWDSVIFDVAGRGALQRVPTLEPLRGTREHVGALLERCRTAEDLVAALTGT
ncbi:proteasome accessory factor A [Kineococcus xinjiangensis]|uniref:Proteasome accessory factor A n=1 Tax=Kineococcus xinjiangensis TaxID=512762 RepID=A0A2S6IKH7_9ACTN|nr:depupylase/deamidase Dop [Kineococcus xinjiangensis]PPK94685.1 proteasome accessory factor A [Kineococcus xinjiangensis]